MKNSVAIVTGASQGIGRSTAIRLAKDFAAVVLVARNADALVEVSNVVRQAGAEPLAIALDLCRVESPEVVIKTTLDAHGRLDALLNIAGTLAGHVPTSRVCSARTSFIPPRLRITCATARNSASQSTDSHENGLPVAGAETSTLPNTNRFTG